MKAYFKVKLIDGTLLDFNKKCTNVNYVDDTYTLFREIVNESNNTYKVLAIIPHKSIFSILKVED